MATEPVADLSKVDAAIEACSDPDADWQTACREALPEMRKFTDALEQYALRLLRESQEPPQRPKPKRRWWTPWRPRGALRNPNGNVVGEHTFDGRGIMSGRGAWAAYEEAERKGW